MVDMCNVDNVPFNFSDIGESEAGESQSHNRLLFSRTRLSCAFIQNLCFSSCPYS